MARLTPTWLAVVLGLLVLGTSPTARATFPGPDGRIAFSYGDQFPGGDLGFHSDIYTIRPNGSHLQRLTHVPDPAAAALPSWSPDGSKIAFESNVSGNYEIWVMDSDGRHKTQITDEPRFEHLTPSWSPDGTQIVYSRCDMPFGFIGSCDISVMSADGSYAYRVVGGHRIHVRPVFSPDGTSIAFASDRAGFTLGRLGRERRRNRPSAADEPRYRGLLAGLVPGRRANPVHRQLLSCPTATSGASGPTARDSPA